MPDPPEPRPSAGESVPREQVAFAATPAEGGALEPGALLHPERLGQELEAERDALGGVLDRLELGVFVLEGSGRLLRANHRALALLGRGDAFMVKEDGCLRALHGGDDRALQQAVQAEAQRAASTDASGVPRVVVVRRPGELMALRVVVSPLAPELRPLIEGTSGGLVALFVIDPSCRLRAPAEVLARLWGFTPAEARLAALLAQGATLAGAARALAIRSNTARNHLKRVFTKTGVRRQAALVSLLLTALPQLRYGGGETAE
ncbi:MAG: transcriptional regulator [Planctomycetota bacterium]|nr:MAG: transcriptional regulator [Planctomycetota bacterium]